jgi:hypothetical protein
MPAVAASETIPGRFLDNGGAWIHVEHPDNGYSVGMLDASPAIQAALDTGKHVRFTKDVTYNVGTRLALNHSGQIVHLNGSTIATTGALVSAFSIGNTGADVFVKTDDITIRSGFITGLADGTGSPGAPPYAIGVLPPTTIPYAEGLGCSGVKVHNVRASGFCFGLFATGADDVVVTKCRFGGMKYYAGLSAGGYSVLTQTCFNVRLINNRFTATTNDRHAIYVSADPNRTFDNNNVCKSVIVKGNRFNWTGVGGTTGFEAPLEIRSAENVTVLGNVFLGGYGAIDYDAENGNGINFVCQGNTFSGQTAGASSRACITVTRSSGSYLTSTVAITGNTFRINNANLYGIILAFVKGVNVSGNSGTLTLGIALVGVSGTVTGAYLGGNTWDNTAEYCYEFAGTGNDTITMGRDTMVLSGGGLAAHFLTTPTNFRYAFPRTAIVNATSSGAPTIGSDEFGIIDSVANHANGLAVTLASRVESPTVARVLVRHCTAAVANSLVSAIAAQVATLDARNTAGTVLPGASNSYTLVVEVTS